VAVTGKRWSTIDWPTAYERKHASKVAAYRYVEQQQEAHVSGRSRVNVVVVKVSEGKGPWQTYERVRFDS
jgi:hypothetical protein